MKKTVWIARTAVCLALLIAIQFLGLYFKLKQAHADGGAAVPGDDDIIEI